MEDYPFGQVDNLSPMLFYLTRNADSNSICRNILCHHRSGTDNSAVTYFDTSQDCDPATEPNIIADLNRFGCDALFLMTISLAL